MNISLNAFYRAIGTSKQAVHQYMERLMEQQGMEQQVLYLVSLVRQDHPGMGLRDIYYKIQPEGMGRDKFEGLCAVHGFSVKRPRNYSRTTDSSGVCRFENLIENLLIDRVNQVWQSDITYYEVKGKFYYITLIQDAYSKVIVGYSVSKRLTTEQTTLAALKMALKYRRGQALAGLIFHSDGGGQYYDKAFVGLTKSKGIRNSMCSHAWENGMAERLNGVIKNNYLKYRHIESFEGLKLEVDRTVLLYNHDKPHSVLNRQPPLVFENNWIYLQSQTKAKVTESFDAKHQKNGASSPHSFEPNKSSESGCIICKK